MARTRGPRLTFRRRGWPWLAVVLVAIALQAFRTAAPDLGGGGLDGAAAYQARQSDVQLEVTGAVVRSLADDNEGGRHQRFIVRVAEDHTVLIVHNIDLAPRVPVSRGDEVAVFGEYVWNHRGGLIHWTHHDPDGSHVDGWIRHQGRVYQ